MTVELKNLIEEINYHFNSIKNTAKDLTTDLHIYNHRVNNSPLEQEFDYSDSTSANMVELFARTAEELERDIRYALNTLNNHVKNFVKKANAINEDNKNQKLVEKMKQEFAFGYISTIPDGQTHPVCNNMVNIIIQNIIHYIYQIKRNLFLNDIYNELLTTNVIATSLFKNPTPEVEQFLYN